MNHSPDAGTRHLECWSDPDIKFIQQEQILVVLVGPYLSQGRYWLNQFHDRIYFYPYYGDDDEDGDESSIHPDYVDIMDFLLSRKDCHFIFSIDRGLILGSPASEIVLC